VLPCITDNGRNVDVGPGDIVVSVLTANGARTPILDEGTADGA
jgi:hypothetical protein